MYPSRSDLAQNDESRAGGLTRAGEARVWGGLFPGLVCKTVCCPSGLPLLFLFQSSLGAAVLFWNARAREVDAWKR